jgi:pyrroloquinoline quinone (PQQ) biosynthesis protein C
MDCALIEHHLTARLEHFSQHPFIVDANASQLSRDQVHRWIMCAGRESKSFVSILQNLTSWCQRSKINQILLANLNDELGDGNPEEAHYKHYLRLLDDVGIPRSEFVSYRENNGIKLALRLAYSISLAKREAWALGYMLINEAMTPITYGAAKAALTKYHPSLKTDFFDLHIETDAIHLKNLFEAVAELATSDEKDVLYGLDAGERGMAVLLDEAYGIFDYSGELESQQ